MKWPKTALIKEVGPRDGLQNESTTLSTAGKIEWIDSLSKTGLSYIEAASFVNPKWIPQLSDSLEVMQGITREEGVVYGALVPNLKGLERALQGKVDEIAVFMSATETHNQRNINKTIADTIPVLSETALEAISAGKKVRGYLSTVFGCPYEGEVSTESVLKMTEKLLEMGIYELSLGDTIGVADPRLVEEVLGEILKRYDPSLFALHFHDTRGMALANVLKSLEMGFFVFDSSLGGLGGCPYAPGASGNAATDDLVHMLERMGIHTGVNEDKLLHSAEMLQCKLNRNLPSHKMAVYNSAHA
ncbi:hydroxymethylglutaryl-CoA lyase [Peribacillus kribbensis]|uniref:hydroxymethylglutaryl-CoA lyase n=1 Tax=Peribacillus kribbensis TaxID=356658 RepID=UPI00040D715D|nr:hydroxymethylglutaryl-CoA lyase [Peribacillus kribbensis]